MAIKVSGTTVIDDSRGFFPEDITGAFSNLHPTLALNFTSTINFASPAQSIDMTGNTTYATAGLATGRQLTFNLDRSTSGYTPTFGAEVEFAGGTPTWSNRRHWLISFTCWSNTNIRATAIGFDEPGTSSSSMDPTFSLSNWDTFQIFDYGTNFEQAWCYVKFNHDTSNNRVKVEYAHGTTQAMATVYTEYIDYTGMTGTITPTCQYNGSFSASGITNQATFGPRPEDDGYNSGTYYSIPTGNGVRTFGWMAANNPNSIGSVSTVTGQFSSPAFRVKLVSNEGTFYSTGSWTLNMSLSANYGNSGPA